MSTVVIVIAQVNPIVGDIDGNTQLVIESVKNAEISHHADIVVFPELTLSGYPPEDLLLRPSMQRRISSALAFLAQQEFQAMVLLGYPKVVGSKRFNVAGVLKDRRWIAEYAKQQLPNYQVFDEKRYFSSGKEPCVFDLKGIPTAITICEDIWHQQIAEQANITDAQLMININASPFHRGKQQQRHQLLSQRARQAGMPIIYSNQVGGQDELVFDGGSFVVDKDGSPVAQAPLFQQGLFPVCIEITNRHLKYLSSPDQSIQPPTTELSCIYQALTLGVKDYVEKNNFNGVVLGLSGGIDSALTLAIAVDALGKDRIEAVMMPFRYTSRLSRESAAYQARCLGVSYHCISIESTYQAMMDSLADSLPESFADAPPSTTEENLQARCRCVLLMAISNKKGLLVLTTGNKSELAVGYSTLYGDMAGGFDILKDVPKTMVFELAKYRNTLSEVIPISVIERPPSAELAPNQKDEDSLPPYDQLDQILALYVEQDCSADEIIKRGFDKDTVNRVIQLVDVNEHKRRQAPIGVRITERGFGRDRRYPITNGWTPGE